MQDLIIFLEVQGNGIHKLDQTRVYISPLTDIVKFHFQEQITDCRFVSFITTDFHI